MNTLYDKARERFLSAQLDWNTADIRAVAVTADYVFDATHQFLVSIPFAQRIATATLDNRYADDGYAQSDPARFEDVTDSIAALVLYEHTGDSATAGLIAYIDEGVTLPTTVDGNYRVAPDSSALQGAWFRL